MAQKLNSSFLCGFLGEVGKDTIEDWAPVELGMILDHQISLNIFDGETASSAAGLCAERDRCVCRSYQEFFVCSSDACIQTTRFVKDHAKSLIEGEPDFPRDVSKVLYLLAILRSKRSKISGITTISDEEIKRQVRQTWR